MISLDQVRANWENLPSTDVAISTGLFIYACGSLDKWIIKYSAKLVLHIFCGSRENWFTKPFAENIYSICNGSNILLMTNCQAFARNEFIFQEKITWSWLAIVTDSIHWKLYRIRKLCIERIRVSPVRSKLLGIFLICIPFLLTYVRLN